MPVQDNTSYFEIAQCNPEPIFSEDYAHLERHGNMPAKISCVNEIIRRLAKMQKQISRGKPISVGAYETLRALCKNSAAKHSPFGVFVTV